jgi:amino acid transporter
MLAVVGFWFQGKDGFDTLVDCTAPVFCLFFFLTGTSLIILRYKEPSVERPFTAPLYPLTPLVFCAFWAFMFYGSVRYAPGEACVGLGVLLAGLPLYALSSGWRPGPRRPPEDALPTFDRSETGIHAISH